MKRIALTGNIGCGKSTVARILKELGAYTLDADEIIRGFYSKKSEVYRQVLEEFGKVILDEKGNIDRKKLADIVFRDTAKLKKLEAITHRALKRELEKIFRSLPEDTIVFVEASLLIEKGTHRDYDLTVVVYAPYEVCKERALKRGLSEEDFERRWKHQMDIEEKVKFADFVIDNSDGLEKTKSQVLELLNRIKEDP